MINKTEIGSAIAAADAPLMVETAADLQQAISIWQQCNVIGIDTEFVRERQLLLNQYQTVGKIP